MLAALLILATVVLVVLKVVGVLAISWLVAFLPALFLGVMVAVGLVCLVIAAAVGNKAIRKIDDDFYESLRRDLHR